MSEPDLLRSLQLVQLEMLQEFDRICRDHNITYSLDGGTLLGAVRHGGFIPWDPDIDVIMLHQDYDRFKTCCEHDLDIDRFFLQDMDNDAFYRWGYARLRRKHSEFIRAGHEHMHYQTGIFIDIMIVDHVPDRHVERLFYLGAAYCLRKALWSEAGKVVHQNLLMRGWYTLLAKVPKQMLTYCYKRLATHYNRQKTKLIRRMLAPYPKACRFGTNRAYYEDTMEMVFEGQSFKVFTAYDAYLTLVYGDYMKLPPKAARIPHIPCSTLKLPDKEEIHDSGSSITGRS